MELSVIIPLYNSENYLIECLETLLSVSNDLKIILVNDGSYDNTDKICKEYVDIYKNIQYFEQENMGVSSARNTGLQHVESKYVMFVDGDDCIDANALGKVIKKCSKEDFELCITNYCMFESNGCKKKVGLNSYLEKQKFDVLINRALTSGDLNACWAKIYRADIIKRNDLLFCKDVKIGEDIIFLLDYLKYINSYIYIDECFYYYRENPQSAMHQKISFTRIHDLEKSYYKRVEIAKLYMKNSETIYGDINYYCFIELLYLVIRNKVDDSDFREFVDIIVNKEFLFEILNNIHTSELSRYEKIVWMFLKKKNSFFLLLCEKFRKKIKKGK